MRMTWRAWGLGALLAAGCLLSTGSLQASQVPVVHVKVVAAAGTTRVEAQATGAFEYSTYQPSGRVFVLDLSGVSPADPAGMKHLDAGLIEGYRVLGYSTGNRPNVRLEVLLAPGATVNVDRPDVQDVALVVSSAQRSQNLLEQHPVSLVPASAPVVERKTGAIETIKQVNLSESDGQDSVRILGSGKLTYRSMRLHNPERLVLDFSDSRLRTSADRILSKFSAVREVRMAQFRPDVSRVVIDLGRPDVAFRITSEGDNVTVALGESATAKGSDTSLGARTANLVTTKTIISRNAASSSDALKSSAAVPAPATVLPVNLTQASGALAFPAPAAAKLDATLAAAQAPAATAQTKYTGEPISVDLKDVDLRDFFRLIHEISGLNVVVDPNVRGTLTIALDDVPWDQALEIVLKNNDLDKQLEGNVLRIATKATLRKEAEENRDLALAQAEAANVVTTTRVLSYAKATALVDTLKKFLSPRGDIIADDRSNTLIIRDIPSTLPVIDNLIRELDRRSQQVEIEARVVEASRSFAREIGTQFGLAAGSPSRNNVVAGGTGVNTPLTPPTPPPVVVGGSSTGSTNTGIPAVTNLGASVATSGIAYGFSSTNVALDLIITAAENRGVGKLLSQPKVITQNNEKAVVKQGTKIPVQTIVNNTVSVQFVDAVLELDVTPQITADGTVYMDVTVQNDQIDQAIPRVQGIPAIDTQSAETKVTVNDGATVVIGGIIVTSQHTSIDQVPLVGSIPVIGNLFKHTTVSSSSAELLFFLTPRILPS